MNGFLLALSATLALFFLLLLLFSALTKKQREEKARLNSLKKKEEKKPRRRKERCEPTDKKATSDNPVRGALEKAVNAVGDELYVAGIALRAEEFLTAWLAAAVALPLLLRFLGLSGVVCTGLAGLLAAVPVLIVRVRSAKQKKLFDAQLPDAVTIICNSLRAGFSIRTAIDNIAQEMADPLRREFRRVSLECGYGIPLEESLSRLAQRTGSEDLGLMVNAIVIQKQVGGNLSEVLGNISETINARIKLGNEIKVLTSQGKLSGYIIGLLPIFMVLIMMVVNPSYMTDFINDPTGRILLMAAGVMEVLGFIIVKKIITIKF